MKIQYGEEDKATVGEFYSLLITGPKVKDKTFGFEKHMFMVRYEYNPDKLSMKYSTAFPAVFDFKHFNIRNEAPKDWWEM